LVLASIWLEFDSMNPPLPSISWISATVPKAGNRREENEDAVAASSESLRFAVADGASEGWESGKWAAHLANAYVDEPPSPANFETWLAATRQAWKTPPETGPAHWYAEIKQKSGSFSTLLGVEFRIAPKARTWMWKAVAIGDSCLFQLRNGRLEGMFPISSSVGFGNNPPLVPSLPASICPEPEWLAGRSDPQDLFLLATDAIAVYLAKLPTPDAWSPVLDAIREGLQIRDPKHLRELFHTVQAARNDDLSLIAFQIPGVPETPI
jgi:hypothetical protein